VKAPSDPDRNAQFEYINAKVAEAQRQHQPVISVDTKKKELIGNYKNGGTDYMSDASAQRVAGNGMSPLSPTCSLARTISKRPERT